MPVRSTLWDEGMFIEVVRDISIYRNLIRELVMKELRMKYSKPLLGYFWAFLSPFSLVTVFYLVFVVFLHVKIEESPFILYLMTAVFPWRMFQDAISASATSLVDNKNLIREAQFPHYIIPLAITLATAINFLPALGIVIIVSMLVFRGLPLYFVLLPFVVLIQLFFAIGLSVICAVVYVKWRDLKHVLDPVLMLWFYLIPGFYSLTLAKETLQPAMYVTYILNPWVALLCLYRIVLLKGFYSKISGLVPLSVILFVPILFVLVSSATAIFLYKKSRPWINDHLSYRQYR